MSTLAGRLAGVFKKDLTRLDPIKPVPILRFDKIITGLKLSPRIKSIERLSSAGNNYFKTLYLPAIKRYVESVQLIPASAAHHHAGPGGLVIHTLEVIDIALTIRKSYNLPQYSSPEIIYAQEHIWSYAIFAGALLHDIGKIACNTRIKLDTGSYWTPHEGSIYDTGAKRYHIEFARYRYGLHTQLANTYFHLLPPKGRAWLTQYPEILGQLSAWLMGDYYEHGAIGEIVRQADGLSVASNLKIGGDRNRFPKTNVVPLVDRLTTALRELLDNGTLKINRPDGSAGWCDEQYTYLVCGTTADAVKQYLYASGATDIPGDNSRIFDIWQDHGYAISTKEGGAIWRLKVNEILTLTVLKFETTRLFHPSRIPGPFKGSLIVTGNSDPSPTVAPNSTEQISPTDVVSHNSTEQKLPTPHYPKPIISATADVSSNSTASTAVKSNTPQNLPQDPFGATNRSSAPDTDHVNIINMVDQRDTQPGPNLSETPNQSTAPNSLSLEDPDIAHAFLDWVRNGIRDGKLFTNRSDAQIHIVNEGVLLVSPIIFKAFIRANDYLLSGDITIDKATNLLQKKLQRMMSKADLHRKTEKGMNIHAYQINGANKTSTIRGWLLPVSAVYGELTAPSVNKKLQNLSGFLKKGISV